MNSRKQRKTTSSIVKNTLLLGLTVSVVGCGSTGPATYDKYALSNQEQQLINNKPAYLQAQFQTLFEEGQRNKVLNLLQIGKTALLNGNVDEAEKVFDQALAEIETVYADTEDARMARSLWYEEGSKAFKGEPYERAMAYYYRGLVYLYRNEFDNARASFLSGLMQDAFAEEEQNRSDFALLMFLAGWSAQQMGAQGLAEDAYNELRQFRPDFPLPDPSHDTLIIAETGKSPRKLADGVGHYQLVYRRGKKFKDQRVSLATASQEVTLFPMEDIYWQAASRGGRPVDRIVEGKAEFKKNTEAFGSALSSVSNTAMVYSGGLGSTSGTNAGAALSLIGVASMAISMNARPRADTRYWDNLPDLVHVTTTRSDSIGNGVEFIFQDKDGQPLNTQAANLNHQTEQQTIIWAANEY
ncbi:hypothetical protein DXV75_03465 [Alteromonas aestuariivivens]|uniref:Tetratricopeptide repeat protein n=1 Tax=Alteromonas aestuariivivens TaxID=1938339 RepID=A0A3D8MC25_9ALTE|nr:hypothetical protein [Alteromonas aestuariivivens]RDV28036.1 hypothetical protein DXV75_03465 [Alteromonas aestuariivivens]